MIETPERVQIVENTPAVPPVSLYETIQAAFALIGQTISSAIAEVIETLASAVRSCHTDNRGRVTLDMSTQEKRSEVHIDTWKEHVTQELDILREKFPEAYDRIPLFLASPPENINGHSYSACFYGVINDRHQTQAHMMSTIVTISMTSNWYKQSGLTPIERLVMGFYGPFPGFHREAVGFGLTREEFKGWLQDHYRQSQERLARVN